MGFVFGVVGEPRRNRDLCGRVFLNASRGFFVGLEMARTHRQPTVAELGQQLTDRAFVQHEAEPSFQLVTQIHTPPAHHPMTGRIGTWDLWRRQIVQAAQALGVVAMHPIPQGLAIHAAALRRRLPIRPIEHHGKSQHPPRRGTILLSARRRTELLCRQIKSSQSFPDLGIPK